MKQYRHLLIVQPERAPKEAWDVVTKGIELHQSQGFRISDYHDTQAFTVLVFEKDDAVDQAQIAEPEYKHFPRPCPYCKRKENINHYFQGPGSSWYYMCDNTACGARGPVRPTQELALAAWNGSPSL